MDHAAPDADPAAAGEDVEGASAASSAGTDGTGAAGATADGETLVVAALWPGVGS